MWHERPSTVAEADHLIQQVRDCRRENADLPAVVCKCDDLLAELIACRAALIPEQRES